MWCPKCKAEYRDGITICAECGVSLVESLPVEIDTSPLEERLDTLKRMDSRENLRSLSDGNKAYVEKSTKYEDMRSTAFSFLFIGCAGIILLILVYAGIIPLQFAAYMKSIMGIVMGGMFFIFLIIGIRSYQKLSGLKSQILTERMKTDAAKGWFFEKFTAKAVDQAADIQAADELQQKFFLRSSYIKHALSEQFPHYEDSFLEYLTEQFYEELFPND